MRARMRAGEKKKRCCHFGQYRPFCNPNKANCKKKEEKRRTGIGGQNKIMFANTFL